MPKILLYNFSDVSLSKIRFASARLKIQIQIVNPSDYVLTLGSLLEGKKQSEPLPTDSFTDEMMVMCGFSQTLLNGFLQALKQYHVPKVELKAVLTETNIGWTSLELHQELCKEREALQQNKLIHQ